MAQADGTMHGISGMTPEPLSVNNVSPPNVLLFWPSLIQGMIGDSLVPSKQRDELNTFETIISRLPESGAVQFYSPESFVYAICEILATSPELDMVHFGPQFKLDHLEMFAKNIGPAKAQKIKHLLLEYQLESLICPNFFRICQLLPKLKTIYFVYRHEDNLKGTIGSNTLAGDLVFTSLASTRKVHGDDIIQHKSFYPIALESQFQKQRMNNALPRIEFMAVRQVSLRQN